MGSRARSERSPISCSGLIPASRRRNSFRISAGESAPSCCTARPGSRARGRSSPSRTSQRRTPGRPGSAVAPAPPAAVADGVGAAREDVGSRRAPRRARRRRPGAPAGRACCGPAPRQPGLHALAPRQDERHRVGLALALAEVDRAIDEPRPPPRGRPAGQSMTATGAAARLALEPALRGRNCAIAPLQLGPRAATRRRAQPSPATGIAGDGVLGRDAGPRPAAASIASQ